MPFSCLRSAVEYLTFEMIKLSLAIFVPSFPTLPPFFISLDHSSFFSCRNRSSTNCVTGVGVLGMFALPLRALLHRFFVPRSVGDLVVVLSLSLSHRWSSILRVSADSLVIVRRLGTVASASASEPDPRGS